MKRLSLRYPSIINVRVDVPTREWLDQRSLAAGLPLSTFARKILEAEAIRDVQQGDGGSDGGLLSSRRS